MAFKVYRQFYALFSGIRVHFSDIVLIYFIFHFGWYYLIDLVDPFLFTIVFFSPHIAAQSNRWSHFEFDSVTIKIIFKNLYILQMLV